MSGGPDMGAMNSNDAHNMAIPPIDPPCFDATPESILFDAESLIKAGSLLQDTIVEDIEPSTATFANTIFPLVCQENKILYQRQLIQFYGYVSHSEELRQAARRARDLFTEFDTKTSIRSDLHRLIVAVHSRPGVLDTESQHLVETLLSESIRQGLAATSDHRIRLQKIDAELRQIGDDYLDDLQRPRCIDIHLERDGLDGVPQRLLGILKDTNNESDECLRLKIAGRMQLFDLLSHVRHHKVREKLYREYTDQHCSNAALLERAMVLRSEKAQILGFDSYAELSMDSRMESDPRIVERLLKDLSVIVQPFRDSIVGKWRRMKKEDLSLGGEPDEGGFYLWDRPYYTRLMMERDFAVESENVGSHFPLEYTISRMLGIFGHLFGLSFVNMRGHTDVRCGRDNIATNAIWHEDVLLFAVWDSSKSTQERPEFLGYLYMDLYIRDGKRPGFADLPIRPGFTGEDGTRFYPSTCLICNFEKPLRDNSCLLRHEEVVLLFHELGHGIHDIVAKTKFARFHGASTAPDFNEAPSQMLENWCWIPETLRLLGRSHDTLWPEARQIRQLDPHDVMTGDLDTTGRLPADLMERLVNSKRAKDVLQCLALLSMSSFEASVNRFSLQNEGGSRNITSQFHNAMEAIFGFDVPENPPPSQAIEAYHFTMDGIYIYLTSQVYSADMFHAAFKQEPMNREQGLRYRKIVLEKGSSENEMGFLEEFLRRRPNLEALKMELQKFKFE